ncbi:TPA: hypothetical protein N0F65_003324 [Lagenidium giganteum]|uniref:EF-hand domain-containing protein n=1 Tax=Lagenidium giganteum TaxID=4803 RepID=A0AAV2ZBX8_9STRA|nr:TPA: hypothetical protein N0F65_003324 [Lagenidium giganteum]
MRSTLEERHPPRTTAAAAAATASTAPMPDRARQAAQNDSALTIDIADLLAAFGTDVTAVPRNGGAAQPPAVTCPYAPVQSPLACGSPMTAVRLGLEKRRQLGSMRSSRRTNRTNGTTNPLFKLGNKVPLQKARHEFRLKILVAFRVALSVCAASFLCLRVKNEEGLYAWVMMPRDFYLGGVMAAILAIYPVGVNVGASLEKGWAVYVGVVLALVTHCFMFTVIPLTHNHLVSVGLYADYERQKTFKWYMSLQDVFTFLPLVTLFMFCVLAAPMAILIKTFSILTSLNFALTMLNPMSISHPDRLASLKWDAPDGPRMLIHNLLIYNGVGIIGTVITFITMFIPFPIFACKRLQAMMDKAPEELSDLLELMIDSYCFRTNKLSEMAFVRSKITRSLESAKVKHAAMEELLVNAWWEDIVGFGHLFNYHRTAMIQLVNLYGELLRSMCAIKTAMEAEQRGRLHLKLMQLLQDDLNTVQAETGDLYEETADWGRKTGKPVEVGDAELLQEDLKDLMDKYVKHYTVILEEDVRDPSDIRDTLATNMFICAFHNYCQHVCAFAAVYNTAVTTKLPLHTRFGRFLLWNLHHFLDKTKYPKPMLLFAARTSISVLLGILVAVSSMNFIPRVPTVIALAAQNYLGGTFNKTVNRILGVVFGCALPMILQYYICDLCSGLDSQTELIVTVILNALVLILIVGFAKYVDLSGGFTALAGRVAAYSGTITLVRTDGRGGLTCPIVLPTNVTLIMYATFTETINGLFILLATELVIQPRGARSLLKEKTASALEAIGDAYEALFQHHLADQRRHCGDYQRLTKQDLATTRTAIAQHIPAFIQTQKQLLEDATLEPQLWRVQFSRTKFQQTTDICDLLLDELQTIARMVDWEVFAQAPHDLHTSSALVFRPWNPVTDVSMLKHQDGYFNAQDEMKRTVIGTLNTLCTLMGPVVQYLNPDRSAVFMQLKEAFRRCDVECRRELNVEELAKMFISIIPQRINYATLDERPEESMEYDESLQLAHEFMVLGDHDRDGYISFPEFMSVLERHGCRLEVTRTTSAPQAPQKARAGSVREQLVRVMSSVSNTSSSDKVIEEQHAVPLLEEDLLYVESFTISDTANRLKKTFCDYTVAALAEPKSSPEQTDLSRTEIEQIMLTSCLICVSDSVADKLATLNTVAVSS